MNATNTKIVRTVSSGINYRRIACPTNDFTSRAFHRS